MKHLFVVFLMVISLISAQTKDTVTVHMSEILVSSSIRATENTPIAFTDIKLKEIQSKSFGQEMPQFLSKSSSMTFYSDAGSMNGYSYMRMRGIDNVRINFTLNGVPLNEPEDQGAYFNNYVDFLNNVESVQIQRGVGTSTNGVASYGGSVNFQSKSFTTDAVNLDFMLGSYNTAKFSLGFQQKLSDNYYTYGRVSTLSTKGYRNNSGNKSISGFFNNMYVSGNDVIQFLTFYGTQQNEMAYLATSVEDLELNPRTNYLSPDEKDDFDYFFNQLQYSHQYDTNLIMNTSLYYIAQSGNYGIKLDDLYNFRLNFDLYGGMINVNYKLDSLQVDFGVHANTYTRRHSMGLNTHDTESIYTNSGNKNEFSSFAKFSYLYKTMIVYLDLQYRGINFKYNPTTSYNLNFEPITWNFFNPKFGLTVKENDINYYVSIGIMHREPTRNDMFNGADDIDATNYSELRDFTRVKPEVVVDTEVGAKYICDDYYININVFNMDFTNEIAQIGRLSYIGLPLKKNVDSSNRWGLEVDGETKITNKFILSGNFTLMDAKISRYDRDYDNKSFPNVTPLLTPSLLINTSLTYDFGFKVSVDSRYIGSSYLDNENTQTVPAAVIFDLRTEFNFKPYIIKINWNNIFNRTYYSSGYVVEGVPYYFIQAPSNLYITFGLEI